MTDSTKKLNDGETFCFEYALTGERPACVQNIETSNTVTVTFWELFDGYNNKIFGKTKIIRLNL